MRRRLFNELKGDVGAICGNGAGTLEKEAHERKAQVLRVVKPDGSVS